MDEKISILLGLARNASAGGNVEEAEKYYTQVLEINPQISEAWFGKGVAAALQSTIVNIRFQEMLTNFKNAIATSENKEEMLANCIVEANINIVSFYKLARKHMQEYVELEKVWSDYVIQIAQCIDYLDEILKWNPKDRITLENIIFLCKDNIEGITYRDKYDNNIPKGWCLTPEYERFLREKLEQSAKVLKEIDPSYEQPTVEVKKPESCFVVTATMGDENNHIVVFLRRFRDEYLKKTKNGEAFTLWYYKNGPYFAEKIKKNRCLKYFSYIFIVIPAYYIAKILMRQKRKNNV